MSLRKIAVIVDPYSSGSLYRSEFAKHEISCIAIQSNHEVPLHFVQDFDRAEFIEVLYPEDDLVWCLAGRNVVAVVAGCDTGIALADDLSRSLGLPGNDPATSFIRRDKHHMQEALRRNSLRHIPTTVFADFNHFLRSSSHFDNETSFVIKPINSAGSEGVCFVNGRHDLIKAMKSSAWEQRNVLGDINTGFVVQSFIRGPEYVVDMILTNGGSFVAAVCRVHKVELNGSKFVCYKVDLLDPQDPTLHDLIEYSKNAARALGCVFGSVHMELIWAQDGPVMIEANARLPGAGLPSLYSRVYNPDLLSAAVCTYLGVAMPPYASRECLGRIVCLVSEAERKFPGLEDGDLERLQMLESYWGHKLYIQEQGVLVKTIDFATCPGVIFLAHESIERLDEDERRARRIFSYYLKESKI